MPTPIQVVIDTNVFVAALRSRRGASNALLFDEFPSADWQNNTSTPLLFEYEEQAARLGALSTYTSSEIERALNALAEHSVRWVPYWRWRPYLSDPDDDFVLELAINSSSGYIISHNVRDFSRAAEFGIEVVTPGQFLAMR